jgi:hypothetical protein
VTKYFNNHFYEKKERTKLALDILVDCAEEVPEEDPDLTEEECIKLKKVFPQCLKRFPHYLNLIFKNIKTQVGIYFELTKEPRTTITFPCRTSD